MSFSNIPVSPGIAAVGAAGLRFAMTEAEARAFRRTADNLSAVMATTVDDALTALKRAVEAAWPTFQELARVLTPPDRPDPRDATSVLAWKAEQAAARRYGLDLVESRGARLSNPLAERRPSGGFRGPALRYPRRARA